MPEHTLEIHTISLASAPARWEQIVRQLVGGGARVVVEDGGVPVAAIISPADLARFSQYEAERARRLAVIDEARAAFADVPPDEVEAEIARALTEVRAEQRRQSANGPT